jgi:hypothetical protein
MNHICATYLPSYSLHISPTLRLLVPSSLQAYRHFSFSEGTWLWHVRSSWRMALQRLADAGTSSCFGGIQPSVRLGSVLTVTVSAAHSSGPLVPSGSLLRYEAVQVYHHHSRLGFRWILYTTTFIRVTTLCGPSHGDWSLGVFSFVRVGW